MRYPLVWDELNVTPNFTVKPFSTDVFFNKEGGVTVSDFYYAVTDLPVSIRTQTQAGGESVTDKTLSSSYNLKASTRPEYYICMRWTHTTESIVRVPHYVRPQVNPIATINSSIWISTVRGTQNTETS